MLYVDRTSITEAGGSLCSRFCHRSKLCRTEVHAGGWVVRRARTDSSVGLDGRLSVRQREYAERTATPDLCRFEVQALKRQLEDEFGLDGAQARISRPCCLIKRHLAVSASVKPEYALAMVTNVPLSQTPNVVGVGLARCRCRVMRQ